MMARKKWKTVLWPTAVERQHTSQAAAYRYVSARVDDRALGLIRTDLVVVHVDEGQGWRVYERCRLDDLVAARNGSTSRRYGAPR